MEEPTVMLLSPDEGLARRFAAWTPQGRRLFLHEDPAEALGEARKRHPWVFVLDARERFGHGEGLLRRLRELASPPEILVLLAESAPIPSPLAPDLVHRGDVDRPALREQLERLLALARVRRGSGIVGDSPAVRELLATIAQVAPLDVPVLIQGESGTGKEMVARALHDRSRRSERPFVSVNVGSLAETLLESELFGHEKGAFTGASARREGVFERADGGTLFLDEVGEMSPAMQVKLLRVLETSEFQRVGGTQTLRSDVRLLTATHRSLQGEIAQGRFRSDLYYRLKVMRIEIPPLRERAGDIALLARHFLDEANERHGTRRKGFTRELMERMEQYAWPGNIRELRNVVMSMSVLAAGEYLGVEDLPDELAEGAPAVGALPIVHPTQGHDGLPPGLQELLGNTLLSLAGELRELRGRVEELEDRLARKAGRAGGHAGDADFIAVGDDGHAPDLASAEEALVRAALRENDGNRRLAAEQLGISERTLYRKLRKYGLN